MNKLSEYMKLLPEYFQKEGGDFLNDFLKGFEELLSKKYTFIDTVDPTVVITYMSMPPWGDFNSQIEGLFNDYDVDDHTYRHSRNKLNAYFETIELFVPFYYYFTRFFNIVLARDNNENNTIITVKSGAASLENFSDGLQNFLDSNPTELPPPPEPVPGEVVDLPFVPEEELISRISDYFDPALTPAQFLDWFASWFSLTLNPGEEYNDAADIAQKNVRCGQMAPLDAPKQTYNRKLIQSIFSINKKKGTRWGLVDPKYPDPLNPGFVGGFLDFFVANMSYSELFNFTTQTPDPLSTVVTYELHEFLKMCMIRDVQRSYSSYQAHSHVNAGGTPEYADGLYVGKTTAIHEKEPYYFWVRITINSGSASLIQKIKTDLSQVIKYVKPAHTYYIVTYFNSNGDKI